MNDELAAITSTAPTKSSWCGRSWRGSRRSIVKVRITAPTQSGKFHKKITHQ